MLHSSMLPDCTLPFESSPPASPVESITSTLLSFTLPQTTPNQSLPHSLKNNGGVHRSFQNGNRNPQDAARYFTTISYTFDQSLPVTNSLCRPGSQAMPFKTSSCSCVSRSAIPASSTHAVTCPDFGSIRAIRSECQMFAQISPRINSSSLRFVTASGPAKTSSVFVT